MKPTTFRDTLLLLFAIGVVMAVLFFGFCGCMAPKPPTSQPADKPDETRPATYFVDVQPFIVDRTWAIEELLWMEEPVAAAFRPSAVGPRFLPPGLADMPEHVVIDNAEELYALRAKSPANVVPVYLCRSLYGNYAGLTCLPPNPCIALARSALRDRATLIHELGHSLSLRDLSSVNDYKCADPVVRLSWMSYCFATRDRFNATEIAAMQSAAPKLFAARRPGALEIRPPIIGCSW